MLTVLLLTMAMKTPSPALAQAADTNADKRAYVEQIAQWRKDREEKLKTEGGWLSVAGLFWFKEGANTLGASPTSDIALPTGAAPGRVGVVTLQDGHVTLQAVEGVEVKANGQPITSQELKSDAAGEPDKVTVGTLTLTVIKRGKRLGFRLFDNNCKGRREFSGLHWYPADPAYRVEAQFVPYDPPKTIPITNVLGDIENTSCPGSLVFTLNGKQLRLDAQEEGNGLFLNFRDLTSGKTTYPAGRFLAAEKPKNGRVILDFNQAYNPPCAFTHFATCPLPPVQNRLAVRIPAGEKTYQVDSASIK